MIAFSWQSVIILAAVNQSVLGKSGTNPDKGGSKGVKMIKKGEGLV